MKITKNLLKKIIFEQVNNDDEDRFQLEVLSFVEYNNVNNVKNKLSNLIPKSFEGDNNPSNTNVRGSNGFYSFWYYFNKEKDALYYAKKILNHLKGENVVVYVLDSNENNPRMRPLFHSESF